MSQFIIELPDNLLKYAEQIALQQNISINRLLSGIIYEKLSFLPDNENILSVRARRANIDACRAVLGKVPDNPPDESDNIDD